MFLESWDLDQFANDAKNIIDDLEKIGIAKRYEIESIPLIVSSNLVQSKHVVIVASGYPERAGIWSYTLWDLYKNTSRSNLATINDYINEMSKRCAWILLDPHFNHQKNTSQDSIKYYFQQLQAAYSFLTKKQQRVTILGFSLGCDAVLQFLQQNPDECHQTNHLILLDPSPPSLGKRKLTFHLSQLVENATCFGMCSSQGDINEFTEIAQMRLKLKPILIECQQHGEIPSLVLSHLLKLGLFE